MDSNEWRKGVAYQEPEKVLPFHVRPLSSADRQKGRACPRGSKTISAALMGFAVIMRVRYDR